MLSLVFNHLHVYPILCPFCFFSVHVLCLFCIHSTSNCICSVPVLVPFSCCVLHMFVFTVDYLQAVLYMHCYKWLKFDTKLEYMYFDLDLVIYIPNLTAHRWVRFKHSNNHLNNPLLVHPCHLWRPRPLRLLIAARCLVPLQHPLHQVLLPLERRSLPRSRTKTQQR